MHDYRTWGRPRGQQPMIGNHHLHPIGNLNSSLPGSVVCGINATHNAWPYTTLLLQRK